MGRLQKQPLHFHTDATAQLHERRSQGSTRTRVDGAWGAPAPRPPPRRRPPPRAARLLGALGGAGAASCSLALCAAGPTWRAGSSTARSGKRLPPPTARARGGRQPRLGSASLRVLGDTWINCSRGGCAHFVHGARAAGPGSVLRVCCSEDWAWAIEILFVCGFATVCLTCGGEGEGSGRVGNGAPARQTARRAPAAGADLAAQRGRASAVLSWSRRRASVPWPIGRTRARWAQTATLGALRARQPSPAAEVRRVGHTRGV